MAKHPWVCSRCHDTGTYGYLGNRESAVFLCTCPAGDLVRNIVRIELDGKKRLLYSYKGKLFEVDPEAMTVRQVDL